MALDDICHLVLIGQTSGGELVVKSSDLGNLFGQDFQYSLVLFFCGVVVLEFILELGNVVRDFLERLRHLLHLSTQGMDALFVDTEKMYDF